MTVRDLIEILEGLPQDIPVTENSCEVIEVVVREEVYLAADNTYHEGLIAKVY